MTSSPRSQASRVVAAIAIALSLASGGYFLLPSGHTIAQVAAPAAPPAEALNQANTLSDAFRNSADKVLPAVVSIRNEIQPRMAKNESKMPRGGQRPQLPKGFEGQLPRGFGGGELDPLLRRFFEEMPEGGQFETPQGPRMSSGSGVIIEPSGIILTNNHVVQGGGKITVRLHDGREFQATDVKTDPNTDIAVVRIKAGSTLPAAALGNSDALRIGDWVLAVGQPFGLENTVTKGIVSATGRAVGITKYDEFIQTDAAINPGNSGGPLVNLKGEVVGINTAISSSSGGFQGVGFAIPVNVAKWVSSQLVKEGKVHRAYLGIGIQGIDQDLASQLNLPSSHGALVTDVQANSPAAKAGFQPQDVIVEFAGAKINNPRNLQAIASRSAIDSTQPVVVLRDGKKHDLHVTLKEAPTNYGERASKQTESPSEAEDSGKYDKFGLQVGPLTNDVAQQLGISGTSGVVITGVEDGSPAEKARLQPSEVITQVSRKPVKSVAEFEAEIKNGSPEKGLLLLVRSAEGSRFVVVKAE
ncbi:MAG TPA: Do family serine endopeptidase [Pirellulaceae bacterium]|jgi:serine protease Do